MLILKTKVSNKRLPACWKKHSPIHSCVATLITTWDVFALTYLTIPLFIWKLSRAIQAASWNYIANVFALHDQQLVYFINFSVTPHNWIRKAVWKQYKKDTLEGIVRTYTETFFVDLRLILIIVLISATQKSTPFINLTIFPILFL